MAASFALDVSKWVDKAKARADEVRRIVAINVSSEVIQMSPVDTGRFRGNWFASQGSPSASVSDQTDKTGATSLARVHEIAGQASAQSFFLTNNLPYAVKLEYGHSKQAPAGMVRVTVERWQGIVSGAVAEAKQKVP